MQIISLLALQQASSLNQEKMRKQIQKVSFSYFLYFYFSSTEF